MEDEILAEFLAESWENLARLDTEIVELEKHPGNAELLASVFRTIHTIKGTCGFLGLKGLGSVAHAGENVLGQMRAGELPVTPLAISLVLRAVDQVKEYLRGLEATGREPLRDNSLLIAELNALAERGDSPAAANPTEIARPTPLPVTAIGPPDASPEPDHERNESPPEAERVADAGKRSVADLSIRVNVDVLDSLMNLVGELVLTRNQLLQMVRGEDESKYAAPIVHLNRVTTDLQEGVMKTRMQPIGNAWSKLPRLVRDLAQQTGKQIELEMVGAETELDRTVLDAIKDPLTHMVRNSADHGLEAPAVRRARGKSETGKVRLNAFHEGGHVIICVEDDGGGIALDKVRDKAVRSGLVAEATAQKMSDKELISLLFRPGFSTADKISSVSGRGVGMDVVKTQIERIGGTVDLSSRVGLGTTIRIKIPLTLAIISALVVESGGLSFAIPQLGIVELVRLAAEDTRKIEKIHNNEVFRLRNRLLPLVHLDEVLGLSHTHSAEQDVNIVVVQVGDDQFGLIVSEVFDTQEIVVKPVGNLLKDIDIYQGTTILGDGRVIMILDVAGIASQFSGQLESALEHEQQRLDQEAELAGQTTSLLLFEAGEEGHMAVPLSLVSRLEEFPRSQIEKTGDQLVVQYRGDLLPLLPLSPSNATAVPDPQPVIVFSEGQRSMGLMVDRIQDIIQDRLSIRVQGHRPGVMGTAIIAGRATAILDTQHFVTSANPEWFKRAAKQAVRRVLLIDDSIFMRQLVGTALETEGFRVLSASSAIEAVERLERGQRFDVIVSDIEMPMMDGFEFAEWLKEHPEVHRGPLLALTSLVDARHEERGLAAGFERYLAKFDARQLLAAINELCAQYESAGVREMSA
ncbi:MAG TPA: hybrid sensor histidine kinase/response regulator [Planctomycetaceae bacterium]|nr:hybrid sensor histidine kinase/response regulator [Planctomycetaceae bacterium]